MKFLGHQGNLITKRENKGYIFILPFIIGFLAFIFVPMMQSFIYSFNELVFDGNLNFKYIGIGNYKRLFTVDTSFREILLNSLSDMLINVPIILIFSLLVAVFLNGKFVGQSTFQIIFFIPVILSAGIMPELFKSDTIRNVIINASSMTGEQSSMFDVSSVSDMLLEMNLNSSFVNYIQYAITNILNVINSSGIQILVFLISLKAIPSSLFEASNIEGATAWEAFWKITFPMILPQLLVNVVYTIIDAFSNNVNPIMQSITKYNFEKFQFGYAASLAWVYFAINIVVLLVLIFIIKQFIKRYD